MDPNLRIRERYVFGRIGLIDLMREPKSATSVEIHHGREKRAWLDQIKQTKNLLGVLLLSLP